MDDFIIDKKNITWKAKPEEKCEGGSDLYAVYPDNTDFMIDKPDVSSVRDSNRKYRVFLETEYLEELYEEITVFISANKTITIDAMFPRGIDVAVSNKCTFVIPIDYPLVPPFVYINDMLYMNIINCCHLERVKVIVAKYVKTYRRYLNCISCGCVLKRENWKSGRMFSDIFSEWALIRKMKKVVGYELALEDLMISRGLEDINITCMLEYLV
jgi:hypothetical protein